MSKIAYEGIGEQVVTFFVNETVAAGQTVRVSGDSTVSLCGDGERFCGVTVAPDRCGTVGVQVSGFVTVKCEDGTVEVGHVKLVGDGKGGVKSAAGGGEHLVVSKDTDTVTILL